MNLFTPKRVIR